MQVKFNPRPLKLGEHAFDELQAHGIALDHRIIQLRAELSECESALGAIVSIIGPLGTRVPTLTPNQTPNERLEQQAREMHETERKLRSERAREGALKSERVINARKRKYNTGGWNAQTMLALEAAGTNGITGRQLSDVANMLIGTASARLSIMKAAGAVVHVPPHYYLPKFAPANAKPAPMLSPRAGLSMSTNKSMVVHSTKDDNNPPVVQTQECA